MPLITTTITPFTRTPSRQNPATFSEDMDYRLSEENSRITQMNNLGSQMNSVADLVNTIETNLNLVANDLTNIDTVATNITKVNTVSTNITKVSNLDTNMTKITNLDTNMTKIANVDNNMSKVSNLDTNMTKIANVDTNINDIISVADNEANINILAAEAQAGTLALKANVNSPALTGTPTVNGVAFSGYSGYKNYIINGKKQINQRGSTSTDNSYNQDRWYKVGNNWYQGIEGDNNLINGKTYTLSWVGNATASYYVGNATSTTINSQSFTTISNGGSFTLTISAGQNLWVKFESDSTGSTFNFVQLEEGSVATPFEQRSYGLELSLCQRYYQVSENANIFSGNVTSGSMYYLSVPFKVNMRVNPSMSYSLLATALFPTTGLAFSISNVVAYASLTANGNGAGWYKFAYTASAEL